MSVFGPYVLGCVGGLFILTYAFIIALERRRNKETERKWQRN